MEKVLKNETMAIPTETSGAKALTQLTRDTVTKVKTQQRNRKKNKSPFKPIRK